MKNFLLVLIMSALISCTPGLKPKMGPPAITTYKKFDNVHFAPSTSPFRFVESNQSEYWGNRLKLPPNFTNVIEKVSLQEFLPTTETIGFMIIRNDSILYEYIDERYKKEPVFTSFSIAKSFMSVITGIAIDQGFINGINDKVIKYIPELKGIVSDDLEISHIMNHTSGLKTPNVNTAYYGANYSKLVKKVTQKTQPPAEFKYDNMNSQILGYIIEKATGQKLQDYFYQNLWSKLNPEFPFSWSLDNKKNNNVKAFCCMNGQMRDFAKLGKLMMQKGSWNKEQIVSEQWVNKVWDYNTTEKSKFTNNLHWWLGPKSYGYLLAGGLYGQYILISPSNNVIIIKFSERSVHLPVYWQAIWLRLLDQL